MFERESGSVPAVVRHLDAKNSLPRPPNSSVMDGCLLGGHKFAHKDVLRAPHCRIAEEGLGQLDTQSAVLASEAWKRRPRA